MSYPQIPLVYATFLAQAASERLGVKGKTNVTVIVHHDQELRSRRLEIENDAQWPAVTEQAVRLFNEGAADTAAVFYPADGDEPVDFGLLLRPNQPPLGLMWTYGPTFAIHLAPDNVVEQISNGAGIEVLQGMLNRAHQGAAIKQDQ